MIVLPLIASALAATISIPACDTLTITSQTPVEVILACGHNPPPPGVKPLRVAVVPLHYLSPPSASTVAVNAYNNSLQYITQAALTATFAPVAAWWTAESYGLQPMVVTVLPEVLLPGNPYCDYWVFQADAAKAVTAAGLTADVTVGVAPYSCWKSKAVGGWGSVTVWNTVQNGAGLYAHEIGHAVGLLHNGSRYGEVYAEYGSGLDQMGAGSDFFNLRHFSSDHKNKLDFLPNPLPCQSATLRSIYTSPDAINCGAWWIDYAPDFGYVYVHKREWGPGQGGGGTDTTDYARLLAGQSFGIGGVVVTHQGQGKVIIQ